MVWPPLEVLFDMGRLNLRYWGITEQLSEKVRQRLQSVSVAHLGIGCFFRQMKLLETLKELRAGKCSRQPCRLPSSFLT